MSQVFFATAQPRKLEKSFSLPVKFIEAVQRAGLGEVIAPKDIVAIKIHFGVPGGFRSIRPQFVGNLVESVRQCGGVPFLTDTWGFRHMEDAIVTGLSYETVKAPIVPTSGIKENDIRKVKLDDGLVLKEVEVAGNVYDADALVTFSHSKGHDSSAYAGALKNLAIGCCSRAMRKALHAKESEERGAEKFQSGMADVAAAILRKFKTKQLHVNYLMDITEFCDCADWSTNPFVPDIGVLASRDVVAVEAASLDLINKAPTLPNSIADKYNLKPGDDKFKIIQGKDPFIQVRAAEKLGLGSSKYELIEV